MARHVVVAVGGPLAVGGLVSKVAAYDACLRAPDRVLVVVILARELSRAAIENVKAVRQLRRPRIFAIAFLRPLRQRLTMAALARNALAFKPPLAMQRLAILQEVLDVLALHVVRACVWLIAGFEHAVHNEDTLLSNLELLCLAIAARGYLDGLCVGREADERRAVIVALTSCARLRVQSVCLELRAVVRPDGRGRVWLESLVYLRGRWVRESGSGFGGLGAGLDGAS